MSNAAVHEGLHLGWWRVSSAATDTLTCTAGLLRDGAKRLEARWESRARAAESARQLVGMSERDLHDIGISSSDVPRILREASAARAVRG